MSAFWNVDRNWKRYPVILNFWKTVVSKLNKARASQQKFPCFSSINHSTYRKLVLNTNSQILGSLTHAKTLKTRGHIQVFEDITKGNVHDGLLSLVNFNRFKTFKLKATQIMGVKYSNCELQDYLRETCVSEN